MITGKAFPRTAADFAVDMPKSGCSQLISYDANIYQQTHDTIMDIGSSCFSYYENRLSKLVTAATTAAQFSGTTISMMTDPDMGLAQDIKNLNTTLAEAQETYNKW